MMSSTTGIGKLPFLPLYSDPSGTMGGGTPLIVAVSKSSNQDDVQVLVRLQVLQAYDQIIFELQQQLLRYKAILDQLSPREDPSLDELKSEAKPLSAAAVRVVNSIVRAKPSRNARRGYEEQDD